MSEQKTFFASLEPKSALAVGLLSGFMSLCTVGFFVLGFMMLKGKISPSTNTAVAAATTNQAAPSQDAPVQTPTPPTDLPKTDKPKVELFVMSYCPYGLQVQKAYLPAWELLKKRTDMDVKFVSYAMHEKKEIDENTLQYCIQKEQNDKYIEYLKCFSDSGDSASCMTSAGVNKNKATACVNKANKDFGITKEYEDQSRWLSGAYPVYPIHKDLNTKYGVQGSPTLVINGVEVTNYARTPESIKQTICAAFKNAPKECDEALSTNSYVAGFGNQVNAGNAAAAGCGV